MDSSNSTNNKAPFDKNDLDNPVFDWENMKTGIFEKIESEDPDFFEKKRKRRPLVWFWFGLLVLAGACIVLMQISHKNKKSTIANVPVAANLNTRSQGLGSGGFINEQNFKETSSGATIESTPLKPFNNLDENLINKSTKKPGKTSEISTILTDPRESGLSQSLISNAGTINSTPSDFYPKSLVSNLLIDKLNSTIVDKKQAFLVEILPNTFIKPVVFNRTISFKKPASPTIHELSENGVEKNNRLARFAILSGGLMSFSKYTGSSAAIDLRNNNTTPYFGYHFGIDYWKPIGKKDFLLMGMDAQFTYQNIDISTQRTVDTLLKNVLLNITSFAVGGLSSENYGDTLVTATENNRLVKYNAYRSLQTQMGYGRQFGSRKWHFTPFVGFAGKFAFNNNGITVAADKSLLYFDNRKPILRRFQLQAFGGIEIERCLTSKASLLLRYRFDKNLQNSSTEEKMSIFFGHHILSVGASVRLGNSL